MKQVRLILIFITTLFLTQAASAQMARIYTSSSGLGNSQIYRIYQDNRGFIWIATENGLSRFDGMSFTTFRYDRNKSNSIASSMVIDLFQDSRGTFWTGTSAGLQIFDSEFSTFTTVDLLDPDLPESDQHISSITEAKIGEEGRIIVASSGHGVYVLDIDTHQIDHKTQSAINDAVKLPFVYKLFIDSRNNLWLSSEEGGIEVISLDDFTLYEDIWAEELISVKESIQGYDFQEVDSNGNIIIGTFSHGILIYDVSIGEIRHSKASEGSRYKVMAVLPNNIAPEYGENTFLLGLENNGLRLFDSETESIREINIPNVPYNMSGWKIHDLMEDNQGNVWVGAFQTGVMVIPESMYGFENMSFSRDQANPYNCCVTSITTDKNGNLWVGSDGGGLFSISDNGDTRNFSTANSSLSNNSIMSLKTDSRGKLWIATYLGGLITYTEKEGFRRFKDHEAIDTEKIVCLEYSSEEDIIYAGTHGSGFIVIDAAKEKVVRTWADDSNKWISTLFIDDAGLLWVGTYNGPMAYDNRVKKLLQYDIYDNLATRVYSFCASRDGNIWIGTGEGLVRFERSSKNTRLYNIADGLPSNTITNILEADDGSIWLSTLNGLSRFSPISEEFKNYYYYDGLQENEFHSRACFKDKDGKLFFGGIKGLTSFYPHIVDNQSHSVPPLYLSSLTVMNENIEYDPQVGSENILDKHITEATKITLSANSRVFSMEFSVLEYTNPQRIVYGYQMEGFDQEWKYARQDSRIVTYTNLPSGKYRMMVKAFFDGEPDTFTYREIDIHILPPWYKTIWAWSIYLVLFILGIYGVKSFMKRHQDLKNEKEISDIKEMKLQMFTNLSHEIRTPLTLVMNPLKTMREGEKDPRQKDLYNLMYRNCLRILRLVNQLMDMRKIDNGQMQLHFLKTDVVYFIKDIMQSFENLAVTRNIRFSITSTDDIIDLWVDQGNFDKIIFNILSNAFKYTPENGEIQVEIYGLKKNDGILKCRAEEYVEFIIKNSGSSIEERNLERVFERFFQEDVRDAKVGSGVGLHLTKMLVELHHGDIRAYNTEEGMAFAVRLPGGHSHLSEEEMTKPSNHKDLYTKIPENGKEHSDSHEDITFAPVDKDSGKPKQTKSKNTIVLVDDDSEMRMYLEMELQSLFNVEVCSTGKEAWARITAIKPDAVVTDFMMEGMDGAELCEKIKKNPDTNHIPVIILTSSGDEGSQQRCIDSGADRFFTKPISLEIMKSAISSAISTRVTIRNKYNREIDYKLNEMEMPDSSKKLVNKVIAIIRENLENPEFSVEDLSREVGMSRVHLNRKLKELMNISPSNLIKSIRLKQAAFILINNDVNISEVAYKVGFSAHSYFSNSFHDYFGMTPKEFVSKYMDCKDEETLNKIFQ